MELLNKETHALYNLRLIALGKATARSLKQAGFTPTQIADILVTADLFQGLLPGLITNIAAFKVGLEGGNYPAQRQ